MYVCLYVYLFYMHIPLDPHMYGVNLLAHPRCARIFIYIDLYVCIHFR